MSIAKILSAIPYGLESKPITVEGDQNRGLPALSIIGLASRGIEESKERIRSALTNSGFIFPRHKLVINLAPAELAKSGSHLDVAIALCILTLSGQLLAADNSEHLYVGELALNGDLRPVKGIISIIECAKRLGQKAIFVPADNADQASLIADEIPIFPVHNLRSL